VSQTGNRKIRICDGGKATATNIIAKNLIYSEPVIYNQ